MTDEKTDRETIIVSEIPYQLNKSKLIERIAELVKEKKIEGISELRDESDKDGLRIVIEPVSYTHLTLPTILRV